MNRILKLALLVFVSVTLNNCSDEEEMCQHTYTQIDINGSAREVTIDYPCKLGPPVNEPVNN